MYSKSGAIVHDIARSTDVPAVAAAMPFATYSIHCDVTTADASLAAGDYSLIQTHIEGWNWSPFAQRDFTISFWVKAAKTGVHCVYLVNSGSDRTYVATYTVNVADTWEWKTIYVTASPSGGTWDYTTGLGIRIGWPLHAGSTYHTTAGSWQTGNFMATSAAVNESDNTANNFKLYGVTMNPGNVGMMFVPRNQTIEELMLARYCQVFGGDSANEAIAVGYSAGTTTHYVIVRPPVSMKATPTLAISSASHFSILNGALTAFACSALTINATYSGKKAAHLTATTSTISGSANAAVALHANTTSALLSLTSRL